MENIDHISFEQASAELLEKVHHTLSAFRQRFEGEDVDFAKLHRELVKRVNDELDLTRSPFIAERKASSIPSPPSLISRVMISGADKAPAIVSFTSLLVRQPL